MQIIPINSLNETVQANITLTPMELIQIKQAMQNNIIEYVLVGIYVAFVLGMIFGYQYHKYRVKKDAERVHGNNS
jgi:hypothetical protein